MLFQKQLPTDFFSCGLSCNIKASGKKDLGLIYSSKPCVGAGVFTQNAVKAHCVTDNQTTLKQLSSIQAIVVNSGNANACTGKDGLKALIEVKKETVKQLKIHENAILTASTGVIGVVLPSEKIISALPSVKSALKENYQDFAEAILTTDLVIKTSEKPVQKASMVGIAKGSGMIHPNMATMLAFIVTDLKIEQEILQKCLIKACNNSFNQISVDGDTSTNDMVIALANGSSGQVIAEDELESLLTQICQDLAKQIVKDGEGASKVFEIKVKGLKDLDLMRCIARGISSSSLVKTAIFGCDPNWGRILAAAGQQGQFELEQASLKIFNTKLLEEGQVCKFDKAQLSRQMAESDYITIELWIGHDLGKEAVAWGCDLTYDYVKINAEYTT